MRDLPRLRHPDYYLEYLTAEQILRKYPNIAIRVEETTELKQVLFIGDKVSGCVKRYEIDIDHIRNADMPTREAYLILLKQCLVAFLNFIN